MKHITSNDEEFSKIMGYINEETTDFYIELLENLEGLGQVIGVLSADDNACFDEDSLEHILKAFVTCLCVEVIFQADIINESKEYIRLAASSICNAVDRIAEFEEALTPSFMSGYNEWSDFFSKGALNNCFIRSLSDDE